MKYIQNIKINPSASISDALKVIEKGAIKIALVVDEHDKLLGTLTDGDIRRAILKGKDLNDKIESVYFRNPTTIKTNEEKSKAIQLCISKKIYQIPVVDNDGKVTDIIVIDELLSPRKLANKVIIMAGGLGKRLRPLTKEVPKPMLKVGNKPILHTIIEQFASHGFTNIIICVNYKSHIIQEYFRDGSRFGVSIDYIVEDKQLGTVGALSLIKEKPDEPFFVMNGDLLTNINFEHMLAFHLENEAHASMCVRKYDLEIPFGVVKINEGKIKKIEEKPVQSFFVSAGIYILNPECIDFIPKNVFFDMPHLFQKLISAGQKVISVPLHEYWLDIGRIEEYKLANSEYFKIFNV